MKFVKTSLHSLFIGPQQNHNFSISFMLGIAEMSDCLIPENQWSQAVCSLHLPFSHVFLMLALSSSQCQFLRVVYVAESDAFVFLECACSL